MRDLYSKTNAPYLIAGALATLVLLASGTLAVAPYVAFLSPIAAFNVALPVALSLSILSTLILALSCKMISRNKKLAAQGAELNEKTELAAEQENTIQSLEPQIKGLNKKVSDLETKLDEISRQANGAATKDEVEELKAKIASAATQEEINKLSNEVKELGTSAATKEGLNKKVSDLETKLDEISRQANGAATKDEVEELKVKIASVATKEELNKLNNEVKELGTSAATKEELKAGLNGTATKDEVKQLRGEFANAATKDEVEQLRGEFASAATKEELEAGLNGAAKDEVKKLIEDAVEELEVKIGNAATKDEVKKLIEDAVEKLKKELMAGLNGAAKDEVKKLIEDAVEERLSSLIKEVEVKEELQMKFYEKGKKRYKTTFDDVILPNGKKQKLKEIYESQKESDAALKKGEGYILHGLPGTGKTMIAKAIASETKDTSAFISVSGSSLFNIKNINDLFKKAEENAPCIVFIDEIEGFGKAYSSDDNIRYLKHFLTKIDGSDHVKGVTVIAATNHIGILDKALVRGGRLCNHIEIPTLGTDTRKKIINEYCQKENLQSIAHTILNNTSEDFSPANLISLLKEIEGCASKVRDKTKTAAICRSFKRTHNIKKVSNKQTNRKIENSIGESQQYTSRPSHKLNDALCDSGYTSICSTLINS
ncbi:AAA family ATPase [Wolbachia endosymbiont (group A) of Merzomyia westermanni]|uniref:AAA family ATPase n=1 Tax=Wolbachia endosymbiont (group A) of Merzomyia westermanni TaxID=2954031 RepID=UPI00223283BF|nr:AAA family ATPase [Wolbachia endosymbiont (group A) of Merzomyia westermanni]